MRFSEYFKLNRTQPYLDFVDIPLNTDLEVFLDPTSIKNLNSTWGHELASLLQTFFDAVLTQIRKGDDTKAIQLLSSLNERNEFHLGYSNGESKGHGFGESSAESVWKELLKSKAVQTGLLKDLEDTTLLIEGIGTDMISDAVCNILRAPLIKYTQDMCLYYNIKLTPNISAGAIWNPLKEKWETGFTSLPMANNEPVILIPKILARYKISYDYQEYYRHYLLPAMQDEHIKAKSSLVHILNDGTPRVTKKSLMEKYGSTKLDIINQATQRPNVLDQYREEILQSNSNPLSHEQLSEIEDTEQPDLNSLLEELSELKTGRETASQYENITEKILSVIMYPSLCNPKREDKIHEGRKRVDITYTNEAKDGFFYWLSMHYPCSHIFVECKNYGKEVGNPEIDQLSGRFSPSRGQVGILICREIEKKEHLNKRCKDTVNDGRGYILTLDDEDINILVSNYIENKNQSFELLNNLWSNLVK